MALNLRGTVSLDGSGWERGLSRMAGSVKSFVASAFGVYAVQAAFRKTIDVASELVNTSKRLGIGIEPLQVLKKAAQDAGTDLEVVAKAFEKVEAARYKAQQGGRGKRVLDAFAALGISPEMLRTMNREQLIMGPLATAARTRAQSDIAGPMTAIFSEAFGKVLPVLQTDFAELEATMRKFGALMDSETAVKLEYLGNAFQYLSQIVAVTLGPALLSLAETIYNIVGGLASYWAWFKGLLGPGSEKAAATMAGTPGFGGFQPGQQEALARAEAMPTPTKEEQLAAAEKAFAEEARKWYEPLDKIKADLEKLAADLSNPKPQVLPPATDDKAPKVKLAKDSGGDALIRVGNFLGSNRNVLESLAMQQVNLLRRIVINTTPKSSGVSTSEW